MRESWEGEIGEFLILPVPHMGNCALRVHDSSFMIPRFGNNSQVMEMSSINHRISIDCVECSTVLNRSELRREIRQECSSVAVAVTTTWTNIQSLL